MPERVPIAERWATDEWPADAWTQSLGAETPDPEPGLIRVRMADLKGEVVEDGGMKALYREQEHPRDPIGRWRKLGVDLPSPDGLLPEIDDADKDSMSRYCGRTESWELNGYLRFNPSGESIHLQVVQKRVDEQMAKHGTLASQGAKEGVGVERLEGDPNKVLGQGIEPATLTPDEWVGKSFVEKGYSSTTTNLDKIGYEQPGASDAPLNTNATWILNVSPDVRAVWGANRRERELVLDRNLKYTITEVTKGSDSGHAGDEWIISATVEPAAAPAADPSAALAVVWDETEHPRDPKGQFAEKAGGKISSLFKFIGKTSQDLSPTERKFVIETNDWSHGKIDADQAKVELGDKLEAVEGSDPKPLDRAVEVIGAVHSVNRRMTPLPVQLGVPQKQMDAGAGFKHGGEETTEGGTSLLVGEPDAKAHFDGVEAMNLTLTDSFPSTGEGEATVVHEIGHVLDVGPLAAAVGAKQAATEPRSTTDPTKQFAPKMVPVMDAIIRTPEMQALLNVQDNEKAPDDLKEFSAYLTSPHEAFARAYAQWVGLRAASFGQTPEERQIGEEMKAAHAKHTIKFGVPEQWDDDDFRPVADAFDKLFSDIGWSRPLGEPND